MRRTFLLGLLLVSSTELAQSAESIVIGGHVALHSEILDEDRKLLLYLPESYRGSTFRYPVLYLLDAGSEFLHTVGIVEFLAGTDQIPELIVLGLTNTNRSRDLTPESGDAEETEFWPAVGGADRFLKFFSEELIPWIDESYRTVPYRIIRGQSFGGLFAIHDYMSATPTFDAYLTSSPGVGWNFNELIKRAPEFFAEGLPRPLFVAAAGRDFPGNLAGIRSFVQVLEEKQPDRDRWRYEFFADEAHYSLVHRSTYNGLRFLYKDWQVSDDIASKADFADYEKHYAGLSKRFGYTIKIPMQSVIRLGNQLLREKRYVEGIRVLEHNLELYPEQPESYWHVGDAYLLSAQPEVARPFFEKAYEKAQEIGAADLEDYKRSLEEVGAQLQGDSR